MQLSREIENQSVAVTLADPNLDDTPLIFVNKAFEAMTGYKSSEILGRNCRFLQAGSDATQAREKIRAAIKKREPVEICLTNFRADQSRFENFLMLQPVKLASGRELICGCQFVISAKPTVALLNAHLTAMDTAFLSLDPLYKRAHMATLTSMKTHNRVALRKVTDHLASLR